MLPAEKIRTTQQNKALHLYCEMLAKELNDAGWDMKAVLFGKVEQKVIEYIRDNIPEHECPIYDIFYQFQQKIDLSWTKESVKQYLWKPIQQVMMNKESTTEMDTVEPSIVYNELSRHLSYKFGVNVEWPDRHGPQGKP